jgi:ADP-ribosylglycohydrolase
VVFEAVARGFSFESAATGADEISAVLRVVPYGIQASSSLVAAYRARVDIGITHTSVVVREAAAFVAALVHRLLEADSLERAITEAFNLLVPGEMTSRLAVYARNSMPRTPVDDVVTEAVHILTSTDSYDQAVFAAIEASRVREAGVAGIVGAFAGAWYGREGIPWPWYLLLANLEYVSAQEKLLLGTRLDQPSPGITG